MAKGYLSQEVSLNSTGISLPEGYESVLLSAFFLIVPYVVGFLFLFLFVSKFDFDLFEVVKNNESSIFVSWLVGYEIVSVLTLLFILLKFISYNPDQKLKFKNKNYNNTRKHNVHYNSVNSKQKKKNVKFPIKR